MIDAGAGIPAARLPHLFRRHAGAGGAAGERAEGTGLGLVICRGLVEAHGGRIRAESAGPGNADRVHPARDRGGERLRSLRPAGARRGYAPAATAEPGEIPRLIEAKRPALVVLDLVLPGVDGIELMRTLPALQDLPVIFVSAYGGGDTIARALKAGAADYIVKPCSPAELAARVLGLRRSGLHPSPPAPRPVPTGYSAAWPP